MAATADTVDKSEEAQNEERSTKTKDEDPWAVVMDDNDENTEKFKDLSSKEKAKYIAVAVSKIVGVLACLYFFICSLKVMSAAFQVLGGKTGGNLFTTEVVGNPFSGLIIGILVTVLVQSSSTSTSIIITMVGAGILHVHEAIPMIMGTNIGTSVTNTIVALTQSMDRQQFRKSFAGATVHDMFNFLTVVILLPVEVISGYLETVTGAIIEGSTFEQGEEPPELLDAIIDPVVHHVLQVNKTLINLVAQDIPVEDDASMVKKWCERQSANVTIAGNSSDCNSTLAVTNCTEEVIVGVRLCDVHDFIFANTGMSDPLVGSINLIMSLVALSFCLIVMVKLLSSMLKGSVARIIKKVINTNPPYPFGWITGYLAIIVGALLTFLVQSSSVFTSSITPLVGMGVISVKRMYPLTLGSNIGTTATGILAALATENDVGIAAALQLSLCHLFFNITGIIIWYPIPILRRLPIRAAKTLGNTTAKYRWFAVLYLLTAFFLLPVMFLGLSVAGVWVLGGVLIVIVVIIIFVIVVNLLQSRKPNWLPAALRTWEFLPIFLRSFEPYDKFFTRYLLCCKCCKESQIEAGASEGSLDKATYENVSVESTGSLRKDDIGMSMDYTIEIADHLVSSKVDPDAQKVQGYDNASFIIETESTQL